MELYANHPWADPDNLEFPENAELVAWRTMAINNTIRIFQKCQPGAIAALAVSTGGEAQLDLIPDESCFPGIVRDPNGRCLMVTGSISTTPSDQLGPMTIRLLMQVVTPAQELDSTAYELGLLYGDMLIGIFHWVERRLFFWREKLPDESDFQYRNYLSRIPPIKKQVDGVDLGTTKLQLTRSAVAAVTVEIVVTPFQSVR